MASVEAMGTGELWALLGDVDARIRDLETLMRATPADTTAFTAMEESRPGLAKFRARLDDELYRRGA